jgi:vacuolar protein sorting-associated protein 54
MLTMSILLTFINIRGKQSRLVQAAQIRIVIEQIIGGLQGSYAAEAVAAAFASGAAAAAAAEAAQEGSIHPLRSSNKDLLDSSKTLARTKSSVTTSNISKQFR